MEAMRISLAQTSILWEAKRENLLNSEELIKPFSGKTDLLVFPEMFTTGFSMNSRNLAESIDEENGTIATIKSWAEKFGFALTGSFIAKEGEYYFNRGFFALPSGEVFFYDKRHLFSISGENRHFSSGNKRLIVNYNGWKICLLICYDLRFPVWSRNVQNEYDLLVYVANWPASRKQVWMNLLTARAIENQCFVCGVNRVGEDGMQLKYSGNSMLIDAKGKCISDIAENQECIKTYEISKKELTNFREKFPVWKDADNFSIDGSFEFKML